MPDQAQMMNKTFSRQFYQRSGFHFYRRIPFATPNWFPGASYPLTLIERDQLIADFEAVSGVILSKMTRDTFIAIVSLMISMYYFRTFPVEAEIALFTVHLFGISYIENKRLKKAWDAPLVVLKNRPALDLCQSNSLFEDRPVKPLSREVIWLGLGLGIVGAGNVVMLLDAGLKHGVEPGSYWSVLAGSAALAAIGLLSMIDVAKRFFVRFKRPKAYRLN